MLIAELKKIELRKKEREKKQQDLQKLISAAEQTAEARYSRYPLLSHGATHTFRRHACVCVCMRACVYVCMRACMCMLCVCRILQAYITGAMCKCACPSCASVENH